ncbi:MAG: DUF4388 domain-containing protein, partial [Deltaproteobacteria bacterium]|nr:DUF4388 domain-containing protein [Deltaproteobacteria bacterium]
QIVQANVGKLRGEYAVYRMLTFNEGIFKMSFLDIDVEPEINKPNSALIMEGMRRLDEYMKYTEQLPPLTTRLEVDSTVLAERLKDIPDNVNKVLRLIDSERSINDIVEMSELDELETLKIISALFFDGIVYDIFARKPQSEKRISSTLPEPQIITTMKTENIQTEDLKKPKTSETWAASVFEKEQKENLPEARTDIGDVTIADSEKSVGISENQPVKSETQLSAEIKEGPEESKSATSDKSDQKSDTYPAEAPVFTAKEPFVSVISDGKENKSPKEQLIENTLIENVTLSTSSYVKGSLLGKRQQKVKTEEKKGFPVVALLLILIIAGVGGYLGYGYYFSKKSGKKLTPDKENKSVVVAEQSSVKVTKEEKGQEEEIRKVSPVNESATPSGQRKEEEKKEEAVAAERGKTEEQQPDVIPPEKKEGGAKKPEEKQIKAEFAPDMEGYNSYLRSAQNMYKSGNL